MSVDHIRYDLLTQQALRAVVRRVLADVAKVGSLPGEHHFYVTFDTRAPGVKLSSRMKEQYPEEMTVVLQHQFWDLAVTDAHFEVALSFNGVSEKLHVPFEAIKGFFDPSVQFGLQFEPQQADAASAAENPAAAEEKGARPRRKPAADEEAPPAVGPAEPVKPAAPKKPPVALVPKDEPEPDKPSGGADVVRLDRFRKK
ncbi:MAG: ClpXP protease specificity-enhancing factor SspB [Alphaproteobacteria bacterium]